MNLDARLREKGKMKTEEQDQLLKSTLELFDFLDDKDIFKSEYEKGLQKRLLEKKNVNEDFENKILTCLTEKGSKTFTEKCYAMLQEYKKETEVSSYNIHVTSTSGIEINPIVLTESKWKFDTVQKIGNMPSVFDHTFKSYMNAFSSSYPTKKARIIFTEGSVTASIKYPHKTHEVSLTTCQAFIIQLVLEGENTREKITNKLNVDPSFKDEFAAQIQSLTTTRKKGDPTFFLEDKSSGDKQKNVLSFNMSYKNPKTKFNIPVAKMKPKVQGVNKELKIQRDNQYIFIYIIDLMLQL